MNTATTDLKAGAHQISGDRRLAAGSAGNAVDGSAQRSAKPVLTTEEKKINFWQNVEGWLMAPWNLEFGAMIAGIATGFFKMTKWTRGQVFFDALIMNPLKALRETPISKILHLRANYVQARADSVASANEMAASVGAKLDTKKAKAAADGLAKKATELKASATATDTAISGSKMLTGLRAWVGKVIDGFAATGFGKSIEKNLRGFFEGRHAKLSSKYASKIDAAKAAFTTEPKKGFGIKDALTGAKPKTDIAVGEHLKPHYDALAAIENDKSLSHADRVTKLEGILKDLTDLKAKKAPKGAVALESAQRRAGNIIQSIEEAIEHAKGAQLYHLPDEAKHLRGMAKGLLTAVGKIPTFHALIAAGTVVGLATVAMTGKKESNEAKQAYQGLVADLGGNEQSPYLQSVHKAYVQQKRDGVVKTGVSALSEAANFGFLALPGGAGMAMVAPQMMPMMLPMFVKENELLNAYAALKKEEQGQLPLEPAQKLQLVKQLVAVQPSVAAHGGVYNTLVTPVATEIMDRKLSVKDTLKLINNDVEFTAIASTAAQKQKAALAAAQATKTPAPTTPEAPAQATGPQTPVKTAEAASVAPMAVVPQATTPVSAEAAYMAAEKPVSAKINGADIALEGKVDNQQLAMAGA